MNAHVPICPKCSQSILPDEPTATDVVEPTHALCPPPIKLCEHGEPADGFCPRCSISATMERFGPLGAPPEVPQPEEPGHVDAEESITAADCTRMLLIFIARRMEALAQDTSRPAVELLEDARTAVEALERVWDFLEPQVTPPARPE